MTSRTRRFATAVVTLFVGGTPGPAQSDAGRGARTNMPWVEQRKLLTVGDLEKVTGLKGLKPHEKNNPRDQMLAFSKQENFAGKPADFLALSVTLVFLEGYWEGFAKGEKNSKAAAPVSGVGDEAFEEVKNCALFFHKGKATVLMTGAGSPLVQSCYLTAEQMREAARIIAARL